jgi:hypothetical protein
MFNAKLLNIMPKVRLSTARKLKLALWERITYKE